ncbi:hypothetical protein ACXR2W_10060 [Leucobacter sp. HY1908]
MSDSPDHPTTPAQDPQQPQQPQAANPAEPTPSSAAPGGLAPSPGIAPPAGMAAPELSQPTEQPQFAQPQFAQEPTAPQYGQPQFEQAQFEQAQSEQPQFAQPQDPTQPQFAQEPAAPQYGQPQFAQDPAAAQFAPAAGGPGEPTAPGGPAGPGGPKKGLSTGAIIGIVGGAIALIILLVVGGLFAFRALSGPADSGDSAGSASSSEGKAIKRAKTPDGTIEQFLNALAEGDANTARKLAGGATSDDLLSDEALAAQLKVAPITAIEVDPVVDEPNDYEATVTASFDIGDTTVTRDFKLWNSRDSWEISDALVSFSLDAFKGLEPQVNGIEVRPSTSQKAFPGAYQISLGLEQFELDSKVDTFVLGDRNDADAMYSLKPRLTEAATEEYRTLVAAALTKCLESTTFTTDCGLEVSQELSGGEKVIDGTIVRTIGTEGEAKLKRLEPTTSYSAPTVVSTYDYITVTTTAQVDNNGTTEEGTLYGGGMMLTPTVDFAEAKPKVTWE